MNVGFRPRAESFFIKFGFIGGVTGDAKKFFAERRSFFVPFGFACEAGAK